MIGQEQSYNIEVTACSPSAVKAAAFKKIKELAKDHPVLVFGLVWNDLERFCLGSLDYVAQLKTDNDVEIAEEVA